MKARWIQSAWLLGVSGVIAPGPWAHAGDPVAAESVEGSIPGIREKQLLANGGFERGLTGWKTEGVRLVGGAGKARTGRRCVRGEVRAQRRGRELWRSLPLRRDRLYRFEVWARADNRSRLTIWLETPRRRTVIANWRHVPRDWKKYQVHFTVEQDGPATVRIVAPSSFWAPVGRMWIDDVALFELPAWNQEEISGPEGFDDFPVLARAGPRTLWAAWLSHRDGRDTLQARRLRLSNNGLAPAGTWQVTDGEERALLDPQLVDAGEGEKVWLVYSTEHGENWDVMAVPLGSGGPGAAVRVTTHPAVDVHPAAALDGAILWVAWESNRDAGRRGVYQAAVREGEAGKPVRLSSGGSNNYQPSVAVVGPGEVWTVWHSFREDNFDLYARRSEAGSPGPELRLTRAPAVDRGAFAVGHRGTLWIAWDHAGYQDYLLGQTSFKRVQIARLQDAEATPPRLEDPPGLRQTRMWQNAESPALAFDRHGLPWIAARVPRDRNVGWDVFFWRHDGKGFSPGRLLSRHKGMNRRPAVALVEDIAVICYQGDDMPGRWLTVEQSHQGSSGVYCGVVALDALPAPRGPLRLVPHSPPTDTFEAASRRRAWGEDRRGWQSSYRGTKLRLLFGDLHEHSDLSVCERTLDETPDQVYQMMRDILRCDFGAITDHGKCLNAYLWAHQRKRVRANHDPGRFVTLLALEWTSTFEKPTPRYPFGHYGHHNLFFADPRYPRWYNAATDITPAQLRRQLTSDGADYVLIPHQLADTGNVPIDWRFHDERASPVAEIFQMRGSYECDGCPRQAELAAAPGCFLQDAWARGTVVGVIASPDHLGGFGKAALYAEKSTRAGILDALRRRRTYGTSGAKIFLDVRVAGLFMGEVGPPPGNEPVEVAVRVDAPSAVRTVEILRNNQVVHSAPGDGPRLDAIWKDEHPPPRCYYYVRITLEDEEMAWSSPVWLGRNKPSSQEDAP